MNSQGPDTVCSKINAAFNDYGLENPEISEYHITLKNMLETLFLKQYANECTEEEKLQRLIRNFIWVYREQLLYNDVISPVIFSMCMRRNSPIVQIDNGQMIAENLEHMKSNYMHANEIVINNTIGELFRILVYAVNFFIDRFDFDDYKRLNGGVAKHLYMNSLERHIHGLWLDDIPEYGDFRANVINLRFRIAVNRIWYTLEEKYKSERNVYAFMALRSQMDPELYKSMVQNHLGAFTPDDCLKVLRDPNAMEVQREFSEFRIF